MKLSHWFLFIVSAVIYAAPLLCSTYCWPLLFVFAAPFLYVAAYNHLTYKHAFLWATIAFTCHLIGVITGIDNFAQGSIIARFAPGIVLVTTCAIFTVLWFMCTNALITLFSLHAPTQKLLLWTVTYTLFILTMEHYCLIGYGRLEGHFLFNPIFALAEQPRFLSLLPYLGKSLLTFLLVCVSGTIAYAGMQKTAQSVAMIGLSTLPWIISSAIPQPTIETPVWLKDVAYIPMKISSLANLTKQATIAQETFYHTAILNPDAKILIMPESSIFCDHLSKEPDLCALWSEKELLRPLHIILGSFRWDGPHYRNTFHWFYNGKLETIFDKRHAMLLTEALPEICSFKLFKDLFFSTFPGITPSNNERPMITVNGTFSFTPYICSELFFNDKPDDTHEKGSTILAITNDLWCMKSNIPKMMCLGAKFRAIQWQRNILYISYAYAYYFDKFGNEINLSVKD